MAELRVTLDNSNNSNAKINRLITYLATDLNDLRQRREFRDDTANVLTSMENSAYKLLTSKTLTLNSRLTQQSQN